MTVLQTSDVAAQAVARAAERLRCAAGAGSPAAPAGPGVRLVTASYLRASVKDLCPDCVRPEEFDALWEAWLPSWTLGHRLERSGAADVVAALVAGGWRGRNSKRQRAAVDMVLSWQALATSVLVRAGLLAGIG